MQNKTQLNQQYGIKDQLQFSLGDNGFVMIDISNQFAKARISTYAGQIISYQPNSAKEDLFFLSDKVQYQEGKAIRGGVPICWPWFGDDTSGFERPPHGFVRNQQWDILSTETLEDGRTSVVLTTADTDMTRELWHYEFNLELQLIIGLNLEMKLKTKNTGKQFFTITQALHTYFKVSDVSNVLIKGLDGKPYIDKLDAFAVKQQADDIIVSQEIDRIYQKSPKQISLTDSGFNRTITISSYGSDTTIVWNPWLTSISKIADLNLESYRNFVCVETANVFTDSLTIIPPGREHVVTTVFSIS
jgi:glucose-6-phosphate 1-epimerase